MDDDTGNGIPPSVTEGPATPDPPRPSIEAFVQYKDRLAADTDGTIGEMMKSYADAQPPEILERLETDVDTFIGVWDKFAAAFPPRPAPPPPQAPPEPPREYAVPEWRRQQISREARRSSQVMDSTFSIGGGIMPEPGTGARREREKTTAEINSLRRRIRESGGNDRAAEFELAAKLFPNGLGRPDHGPEHY